MSSSVTVAVNDATHVAEARRTALDLMRNAGVADELCGKSALVVTELGTNLMKHAGGGTLVLQVLPGKALEVLSLDVGPGIQDPDRCFSDGYSTGPGMGTGLGTGLGAVRRLSSARDIYSVPGQGTAVMARVGTPHPSAENVGAVSVPYPGESMCGDSWGVERNGQHIQMTMADGLGHGHLAAEASRRVVSLARENVLLKPDQLIRYMHPALRDTRGAAVSCALYEQSGNLLEFSGVGNISGSISRGGGPVQRLASMNGTVGLAIPRVQLFRYTWDKGWLLVMHSDGVSAKWSFDRYPGLQEAHPALVAGVLFRDHRRSNDDATIVALRL